MSLYGMMRTGVSGMNAQANRLSTVADNIANSGHDRLQARLAPNSRRWSSRNVTGNYTSGGVTTSVRYAISQQGDLQYTTSTTDLAINGDGFFVVQDPSGKPFLTRAGSFVPDGEGRLVNAAGFYLMGYNCAERHAERRRQRLRRPRAGADLADRADGGPSQERHCSPPTCRPTRPSSPPANLPSANAATATASAKSSLVVYDNLGNEVLLDVYFTKTGANTWEVAVYDQANAAPGDLVPLHRRPACSPADAELRRHQRQAHRRQRRQHRHPRSGRRAVHARPGGHQPARDRLHRARRQGRRQRAERHRQDRDRRGRHRLRAIRERLVQGALPHPDRHGAEPRPAQRAARQRLFAEQRFRRHPHRLPQRGRHRRRRLRARSKTPTSTSPRS